MRKTTINLRKWLLMPLLFVSLIMSAQNVTGDDCESFDVYYADNNNNGNNNIPNSQGSRLFGVTFSMQQASLTSNSTESLTNGVADLTYLTERNYNFHLAGVFVMLKNSCAGLNKKTESEFFII